MMHRLAHGSPLSGHCQARPPEADQALELPNVSRRADTAPGPGRRQTIARRADHGKRRASREPGVPSMSESRTFEALGLSSALLRALAASDYTRPTPNQDQAIPLVLAGH